MVAETKGKPVRAAKSKRSSGQSGAKLLAGPLVIGVGASAGAVDALARFLDKLTPSPNMMPLTDGINFTGTPSS